MTKRNDRYCPVGAVSSVLAGRFSLLILTLCALHFAPCTSFAVTTFVSGAVSGEWTREGNPYIVVDSTWVPEGERLTLTAGVEAFFNEGQGLYVFGAMNAEGRERDSVRLGPTQIVNSWRGVRIRTHQEIDLNYCVVVNRDSVIVMDRGSILSLNHCRLRGGNAVSAPPGVINGTPRHWTMNINNSMISSVATLQMISSELTAQNSILDFRRTLNQMAGIDGESSVTSFSNCTVWGSYVDGWGGYTAVDSCQFLEAIIDDETIVSVSIMGLGYIKNSYVEGSVWFADTPRRDVVVCDNVVMGQFGGSRHLVGIVRNSTVRGIARSDIENVTFENCDFYGDIRFDPRFLNFKMCRFLAPGGEIFLVGDDSRGRASVSFERCFGRVYIVETSVDNLYIDHCTFNLDSTAYNGGSFLLLDPNRDDTTSISNTIINIIGPTESLFNPAYTRYLPEIKYCCIIGYDYLDSRNQIEIDELDSTNIIADPLLNVQNDTAFLRANSPCIDRGDPEFERDPDGTRSDMGAYFYPQWQSVPQTHAEHSSLYELVSFYPNPCNASVTFLNPTLANVDYKLFDLFGRVIIGFDNTAITPQSRKTYDLQNLSTGIYIVISKQNGRTVNSKLIVQK